MKKSGYFFNISSGDQYRFNQYVLRNKIAVKPVAGAPFASKPLYWGDLYTTEMTSLRLAFDIKKFVNIDTSLIPIYSAED